MKCIYILIALGINYAGSAQTPRYVTLGQTAIPKEDACLLIRQNTKVLKKIREHIHFYKDVTALKLVGFDQGDNLTDSVLALAKPMQNLKTLIFEECDLSLLETSLSAFVKLETISVVHSTFFENSFFPLLKDNTVKTLSIQMADPDLQTDSLILLPALTTVNISSEAVFSKANYAPTFQLKTPEGSRNIVMAYFGDHYKPNETGVVSVKRGSKPVTEIPATAIHYPCIRQPVPGIDINDTTFVFEASKKGSFTYESGTTISIDRGAFLKENGQPYDGEVSVFYREFRNPVEIMLSGIPMTNKVNGESQLFKSGGMYEVNAFGRNNEPLKAASDTVIKIDFALTDTSQSFQFFSLNPDGNWTTTDQTVTMQPPAKKVTDNKSVKATRAIREYFWYINGAKAYPDTTCYEARFRNMNYLYTYRKDNLVTTSDSTSYTRHFGYGKDKTVAARALFRVKYYKQTREKEKENKEKHLVFKIVPYKDHVDMPSYVKELATKEFMYTGNLSKEQFKKLFGRKFLSWDLRQELNGEELVFTLKTTKGFVDLEGRVINLRDDRTYSVPKRGGYVLNQKMTRQLRHEARAFNRKDRFDPGTQNDANHRKNMNQQVAAFDYCRQYQNKEEKPMSLEEWKKYVLPYVSQYLNRYDLESSNELGTALVKSGLGFKNIDCYIHSGQMQDIYVNYKDVSPDSVGRQYNTVLFKSINTNYVLSYAGSGLSGYYFKNHPNYIVRFSEDGMMQVTKPDKVSQQKQENMITLDYTDQYQVKGMDSNAITRLILD